MADPTPATQENLQPLSVALKVQELLYDLQTKSYNTGESLKAAGKLKYDGAAHIMASDDEESAYEQKRAIGTAYSDVMVELAEYIDVDETTDIDNQINADIDTPGEIGIKFSFPTNFKQVSAAAFANSIHDFIVNRAIYHWYRQVQPEIAAACQADAAIALEQARKAMYNRVRPKRPAYE